MQVSLIIPSFSNTFGRIYFENCFSFLFEFYKRDHVVFHSSLKEARAKNARNFSSKTPGKLATILTTIKISEYFLYACIVYNLFIELRPMLTGRIAPFIIFYKAFLVYITSTGFFFIISNSCRILFLSHSNSIHITNHFSFRNV